MNLFSFNRMCRRAARHAPYHPEKFIGEYQEEAGRARPRGNFWPRLATIGGTALVAAAAVAITLCTPLFRERPVTVVPGSDGSLPSGSLSMDILVDVPEQAELLRLEKLWNTLYLVGNTYSPAGQADPQHMMMLLHLLGGTAFQGSIVQGFQDALGDLEASRRLGLGENLDMDGGRRLYCRISLGDANRIAKEYFVGLTFQAEDFPTQYVSDGDETGQWIYDQETDSVYLAIGAVGFANPYNRYIVCQRETEGTLIHYQMVGVYTESEEIQGLDKAESFGEYQETLARLAFSGEAVPSALLDVTIRLTDNGWMAVEEAALTEESGSGEIEEQAMERLKSSSLLKEFQWIGTGSAEKLLWLQDVLREFCPVQPGKEGWSLENVKEDPFGFMDAYFWLLVDLQERDQYLFSYNDPDYRDVVERLSLSVPMSEEEYGVKETQFDLIYRFPLEELNTGIARFFQGIRLAPEDFPTAVPEGYTSERAFVYDAVTGCVYMPCAAIGREDPQPLLLICEEEQSQNGRLSYTMLGIEMEYGNEFFRQEDEYATLGVSNRFGDFQQRLWKFAQANPDEILYSAQVTVETSGDRYTIVSLEAAPLDSGDADNLQQAKEWLEASQSLRAAYGVPTL